MPELPLFPLNTVLFPGMVLPLHIFEPRYRQMIGQCLEKDSPFGVVLIKAGDEIAGLVLPHEVGTTAHIIESEKEPDGRMNIITLGRQRFRLRRIIQYEPYLIGDVEFYPFQGGNALDLRERARRLRGLLLVYIHLLSETMGVSLSLQALPTSPTTLAVLAAIILQIPLEEKQKLLETPFYEELFIREEYLVRREQMILAHMMKTAPKDEPELPLYHPRVYRN